MSNALKTFVALFLLAVPDIVAADPPKARPIPEVTIDFSSRTTGGVLPFDTPFAFTATVPKSVQRIEARWIRVPAGALPVTPLECGKVRPETAPGTQVASAANDKPPGALWQRDLFAGSADPTPVSLVIGALDAKEYYVFDFLVTASVDPETLTSFRKRARKVLANRFAGNEKKLVVLGPARTLAPLTALTIFKQDFPQLRDQLLAELSAAAGTCTKFSAPNSPLSPDASYDDIGPAFESMFATGLEHWERVRLATEDYREAVGDTQESLERALAMAEKVVGSAEVSQADRAAHAALVTLVRRIPTDVQAIAHGADPDAPAQRLPLTDPTAAEIALRLKGYESTARRLGELRYWMRDLDTAGALARLVKAGTITAGERTALTGAGEHGIRNAEDAISGLRSRLTTLDLRLTERESALETLAEALQLEAIGATTITSSTLGTYDTFAPTHVAADAGFVYAPELDTAVPYVGANFYFRPVNRDVPLAQKGGFARRFSVNLGMANSVAETNRRGDLFGDKSLVAGVGYRLTDIFRVGLGGVLFQKLDPNPLVSDKELSISPYAALSFDFSLAQTFKGVGTLFH